MVSGHIFFPGRKRARPQGGFVWSRSGIPREQDTHKNRVSIYIERRVNRNYNYVYASNRMRSNRFERDVLLVFEYLEFS